MTCRFPATKVLAIRREVAALADACQDDEPMVRLCATFIKDIDRRRVDHRDNEGCDCWIEAQKAFPFVPPKPRQVTIEEVAGNIDVW